MDLRKASIFTSLGKIYYGLWTENVERGYMAKTLGFDGCRETNPTGSSLSNYLDWDLNQGN